MKEFQNKIKSIVDKLEEYKVSSLKQCLIFLKWIERLLDFAMSEHEYKNQKYKHWSYSRGDIVKVDFGFNVGYELGGVHYAIVLNNRDSFYSGNLVVVPLTSKKNNNKISPFEVDLGTLFYETVDARHDATLRTLNIYELYEEQLIEELNSFKDEFGNMKCLFDKEMSNKYSIISLQLGIEKNIYVDYTYLDEQYLKNKDFYSKELQSYIHLSRELSFMKSGTLAKIDQIRVISKKRIVNPTKKYHALNNIKFSDDTMDLINDKVKELIVFDKS